MAITIRSFQPSDLVRLRQLTIESFVGVSLEQNVEEALGILNGHDWQWRKARHVDEDAAVNAAGIFVAEDSAASATEAVVGYISTIIDRAAGKGRIPNLVVDSAYRGHGLGRQLIAHALEYFRREGLAYAMIETMAQNEIGNHLYRSCGFIEVARQVHFARKL